MDETKQNDKADRGEARPTRIRPNGKGEITDILRVTGHAYQVVHSQEPTWVFYMRLAPIDGDDIGVLQCILRPGPDGMFVQRGQLEYLAWDISPAERK